MKIFFRVYSVAKLFFSLMISGGNYLFNSQCKHCFIPAGTFGFSKSREIVLPENDRKLLNVVVIELLRELLLETINASGGAEIGAIGVLITGFELAETFCKFCNRKIGVIKASSKIMAVNLGNK